MRGSVKGKIWFPDYFCNEALKTTRELQNIMIEFYPISEDLTPDWKAINTILINSLPPDIFVLVHYFGFTNDLSGAEYFCTRYGIDLLQDGAHMMPIIGNNHSSTIIFSPRKLLPLPELGLLVCHWKRPSNASYFKKNNFYIIKWIAIRFLMKFLLMRDISWYKFPYSGKNATFNTQSLFNHSQPKSFSLKMLLEMKKEINQITARRRDNYIYLLKRTRALSKFKPLFEELPEGICPYQFPLIVDTCSDFVVKDMRRHGIPASTWPDLPPEVIDENGHETALWLRNNVIVLPIHQDLNFTHLDKILFYLESRN